MGDVAKEAGVSRSTVSRALREDPRLPPTTIKRIQKIAKKLGYQRDPAFNILASRRQANRSSAANSLNLAYLNFANHEDPAIPLSARERARELGYAFEVFTVSQYPSMEALDRVLWSRGIRGILLPIIRSHDPNLDLTWERYSVVACGVDEVRLPFHAIRPNIFSKVAGTWQACLERGYKRIGAAFPARASHELDIRRVGTLEALARSLPEEQRVPPWTGGFHEGASFRAWLQKWKPDALILGHDHMQDWFPSPAANSAVPPYCALMTRHRREVSGYRTPFDLVGRTAMNLLDQEIRQFSRGIPKDPLTVIVEPEWHEGSSLPWKSGPPPRE